MEPGPGIRKSPYEPGLWFVSAEPGTTLQDHGTQWQVRRLCASRSDLLSTLPACEPACCCPCCRTWKRLLGAGMRWRRSGGVRRLPSTQRMPTCPLAQHTAWVPPLRLLPSQVGSRYRLVKVLGYGSYSAVCLAVDEATGEKVGRRAFFQQAPTSLPPLLPAPPSS